MQEKYISIGKYEDIANKIVAGSYAPKRALKNKNFSIDGLKNAYKEEKDYIDNDMTDEEKVSQLFFQLTSSIEENYLKELGYIEFQEVPNDSQRTYAYHYMRLIRENLGDISTSNFLKVLASEGIDCGSCGAPSCRAFAEDVIKGNAKIEDCLINLYKKDD